MCIQRNQRFQRPSVLQCFPTSARSAVLGVGSAPVICSPANLVCQGYLPVEVPTILV
jgi:hypothetical protein